MPSLVYGGMSHSELSGISGMLPGMCSVPGTHLMPILTLQTAQCPCDSKASLGVPALTGLRAGSGIYSQGSD